MPENEDQFSRGKFEGSVLASLDSIKGSVEQVKNNVKELTATVGTKVDHTTFMEHRIEDTNIGLRVAALEKRMWILAGALGVLTFLSQFLGPIISYFK